MLVSMKIVFEYEYLKRKKKVLPMDKKVRIVIEYRRIIQLD